MLLEILVLIVVIWLLKRRWSLRRQISLGNKLKTNIKSYPIIGHSYIFIGTGEDRMKAFETFGREAIKSGGITPLWLNVLFLCVADPVIGEFLMTKCLEKDETVQVAISFLTGGGSIYAPVPIWRSRRKIVVPTFSVKNLNSFIEAFFKRSIKMTDLMEKEVGKGVFSFWDYIADCNLDTVCENTLGVRLDEKDMDKHELKVALDDLSSMAGSRMCKPWYHSDFMFKFMPEYRLSLKNRDTVRNFVKKIIKDKKKVIENKKAIWPTDTHGNDSSFLDLQLKTSDDRRLTDTQLLEEVLVLVIAGLDTSATGAGFTVLMLSRYPDIQEKVFDELQEVFVDSDLPVTSKDLPRLKYLEIVIKESLRLFPPVPVVTRRVDNDVTLPSGLTITKGCSVMMNIWAVHRNPEYWGVDADQFRPERFLDLTLKHPAAFMPFSYGPRNCIGYQYAMMSMKTVLATLLRRYRVLPPPGVTKDDPVRTSFDIMLRHVDKFKIQLEKRI